MNPLEGVILIMGLCGGMCLSGYWLAGLLTTATAAERLAVSMLAGLASILLLVSLVNYFLPLSWPWAGICLIPLLVTLLWPRIRLALAADWIAFARDRETRLFGGLLAFSFCLLLWPLLADNAISFYDGSPNHDSFFWIAAAEYLKGHSYMLPVVQSQTQPLFNATQAIIGLTPAWGRMGAEGLLALTSSLSGTSVIKLYLYGTAALYLPWTAAIYLVTKNFFSAKLTPLSLVALAALQPLFIFYYANANLPNLLGMLVGAAAAIATEQTLRSATKPAGSFWAWWLLLLLSLHGLYCSYPEMIPFTGLSCALLWLRAWFCRRTPEERRIQLLVAAAAGLSVLINPATSIRAANGFIAVLGIAQANQHYINLFSSLSLSEYLPAFSTLEIPVARGLEAWLSPPLSLALLAGAGLSFWQARDRFGVFALFSGSCVLLIYTLMTGFNYGWQKTVQFSGVFIATIIPVMALHSLWAWTPRAFPVRWLARGGALLIGAFMGYATIRSCLAIHWWSNHKTIAVDWFDLRHASRSSLRQAPVLVEAGTFRMAFFHGMWAAYFLPASHLYYGARGEQSGGYLRDDVINEADQSIPAAAAILVGRDWADTFDANSPRILTGREYALLSRSNRVFALHGVYPLNGVPMVASPRITLEIAPSVTSTLNLILTPKQATAPPPEPGHPWRLHRLTADGRDFTAQVGGPPPWHIKVPLVARQRQSVTVETNTGSSADYPFSISGLIVARAPAPLSPVDGVIDFSPEGGWEDFADIGLRSTPKLGVVTAPDEAILQFAATPAQADMELEWTATLPPDAPAGTALATELWFNDSLIFSGFFGGPGVLRARIFHEHWNQRPVGRFKLRFPGNSATGPGLLLKSLSIRRTTTPRP